jgi:hypothetical protein
MTASVLIHGEIFRAPERKTSQAGKNFVRATIRVGDGDAVEWWSVLAFSETICDEVMELHAGERLAVQGQLKLELYQGKISRTVFASQVLPLCPKRRKKDKPEPATTATATGTSKPPFDDAIGF